MNQCKDFEEFRQAYSTPDHCYRYLCELKWGRGFVCRKCQHGISVKGRLWYYRRCQKCGYDESCTAHTIFHNLKFSIVSAFWIYYEVKASHTGLTAKEIAQMYHINQETAWAFRKKVIQQVKSEKAESFAQIPA